MHSSLPLVFPCAGVDHTHMTQFDLNIEHSDSEQQLDKTHYYAAAAPTHDIIYIITTG